MGTASGRSLEAAFSKAMEGSREQIAELGSCRRECSGEGGVVVVREGGCDGGWD